MREHSLIHRWVSALWQPLSRGYADGLVARLANLSGQWAAGSRFLSWFTRPFDAVAESVVYRRARLAGEALARPFPWVRRAYDNSWLARGEAYFLRQGTMGKFLLLLGPAILFTTLSALLLPFSYALALLGTITLLLVVLLRPEVSLWFVAFYAVNDWLLRKQGLIFPSGVATGQPMTDGTFFVLPTLPDGGIGVLWDKLLFILTLGLWIFRRLTKGPSPFPQPMAVPILLFAGVNLLLLLLQSPDRDAGIDGFRVVVQHIFWFFPVAYLIQKPAHLKGLLYALAIAFTGIALIGDYQFAVKAPIPTSWIDINEGASITRAYSIVGSPNILGSLMVLGIPLGLGLTYAAQSWRGRIYAGGAALIMLAALVFTYSRGALLAFAAGLVLFSLLRDRRILAVMLIGAILLPVVSPAAADRISYLLSPSYLQSSAKGGRVVRWDAAIEKGAASPVIGVGLGQFGGAAAERHKVPGTLYTDNYYLKTFAETGIVGLSALLLLMAAALRQAVSSTLRAAHPYWRSIGAGLAAGIFGVILHNSVENVFEVPMMVAYFWMAVAASSFLSRWEPEDAPAKRWAGSYAPQNGPGK